MGEYFLHHTLIICRKARPHTDVFANAGDSEVISFYEVYEMVSYAPVPQ